VPEKPVEKTEPSPKTAALPKKTATKAPSGRTAPPKKVASPKTVAAKQAAEISGGGPADNPLCASPEFSADNPAEAIVGHRFAHPELLVQALTHPSAVEKFRESLSYERLEFLGDAILGAIVSMMLYQRFPTMSEGGMTRAKVALVSGQSLSALADRLGLAEYIHFGSSERGTGKRGLASALENVYEALVAAVALDGGYPAAYAFVERTLAPLISEETARESENPKSQLQEVLQVRHITPRYELLTTSGPPHERVFTCGVLADDECIGIGTGKTKKDAEARAAAAALANRADAPALPLIE
jgi:ribonuclease-3